MRNDLGILAYYVSRDRVLSLLNPNTLPPSVLACLQGRDVPMASAILSNSLGEYLFGVLGQTHAETLQELAFNGKLQRGASFIYNGHFYTSGFAATNKKTALSLHEKLDEPLKGKKLILEFSKNGLVNDTAYSRLSRSVRLFAYAYITEIDGDTIRAVPYIIGDLVVRPKRSLPLLLEHSMALRPEEIDQFSSIDTTWSPPPKEQFERLKDFPERTIKKLISDLLEHVSPLKSACPYQY